MKIDYALKADILANHNDLLVRQRKARLLDYAISNYDTNGVISPVLRMTIKYPETLAELKDYARENGLLKELNECRKINHAYNVRAIRLNKRVETMLNDGPCKFLTFSFRDNAFANTTPKQRRVAVSRFLKSISSLYVANIDFGDNHEYIDSHGNKRKATQREHYHAIVRIDNFIDKEPWENKFGWLDVENINLPNSKALAKYVAKLTNHAIKETTKRSALIYSR